MVLNYILVGCPCVYGEKFVFQNWLGLYLEGNLRLKIDWASIEVKGNSVTVIDHGNMDRGNPSQEWKLNNGNTNKLWLFLTAIFGTRNSYLANIKIYIIVNRDYFVLLCIWGQFPSRSPLGLIFGRPILRYQFGGGGYIWRGLYMEGLIFGILHCQLE